MIKKPYRPHVVIIDSGIRRSISDLQTYVKRQIGIRISVAMRLVEDPKKRVMNLHGTTIALIIRDLCRNVRVSSINILDKKCRADSRVLLYAMNRAIKMNPDILHMSLGTTNPRYRPWFKQLVARLKRRNCIVVCAAHNEGLISYPASLRHVVRVKADSKVRDKFHYYFSNGFYYGPEAVSQIAGADQLTEIRGGSSVAAAFISGHVARLISECGLSRVKVLRRLRKKPKNNKGAYNE